MNLGDTIQPVTPSSDNLAILFFGRSEPSDVFPSTALLLTLLIPKPGHPSFPPPPRTLSQLEQQLFWAAVLGPLGRVKHFFLYGTAIFCPWKKENGFFWKACLALTPAWCSPCSAVSFPTWLV